MNSVGENPIYIICMCLCVCMCMYTCIHTCILMVNLKVVIFCTDPHMIGIQRIY